ncbi:MAG: hypothetical protein FJ117_17190 [Deltaproteobacteria bacterium]|nr:hypothetical protein [Deltaproteobacteria bacterium]
MIGITKDTQIGATFSGKAKRVSWERLWAFSGGPLSITGWPKKNIHTDLEFARSFGLSSVAASATQYMGYVVELLIGLFGVEWLWHGRMDVKFIGLVDAGDMLISKAQVQYKESRDDSIQFTLAVCCEKQDRTKVLVGSATGMLGKVNFPLNQTQLFFQEALVEHNKKEKKPLAPLEFLVTPELNQQYLFAAEDFHPQYIEETEIGSPIAHPGLLLNMSNPTRSPSFTLDFGPAGIHSRDETFFFQPARVGKKIKVTWEDGEPYVKRDRYYQVFKTSVVEEDGMVIMKRVCHGLVPQRSI